MIIGIPKEIKNNEYRIGMIPGGVHALAQAGHTVLVQKEGGMGSGITDEEFVKAGGEIVEKAEAIWDRSEMIIKVKEPLEEEWPLIKPGHTLFTYFHFASSLPLTDAMIQSGAVCVTYETIEMEDGSLPLLTPMSEVAGRMAIQEGAKYLEKPQMGRGILLGGVPGVEPAHVVVLGGGIVGASAARMAAGLDAHVTILDIDLNRLRHLDEIMPKNVTALFSNAYTVTEKVRSADLLVGAVLSTGAKAPVLVPRSLIAQMKPGAVIVDVAVDQGGCVETCKPTTHADPVFIVDNVLHYCVANMPGAVGRTSTYALSNATLPYAVELANKGFRQAALESKEVARGINILDGKITHEGVAAAFNREYTSVYELLA
jgi:alanine dehydrogenase